MKQNLARAKLKRGEPSVGTWLTLPDPVSARLMARVGFDWLTVELEHTPVNFETAAQSFTVIAGSGCVPMVNSRAEAEAVVRAARYQPLGERSIGGQLHAANFDTDPGTYYARANEEILVVLMIAHIKAIEAADDILSVPGVDVAFIGPNDLHNSMGKKPLFESNDKMFTDAVAHVMKTARKHGVTPGIHVLDAESAQRRINEGFQFIAITSEAGMMLAKAGEFAKALGLGAGKSVAKY